MTGSEKLLELTDDLIKLLDQEQQTIKANIKANVGKSVTAGE